MAQCEGLKPFERYEGEDPILERMNPLRAESLGFVRIAATTNAEGIETRTRRRWYGVIVNRTLGREGK
jgi:hypothetical protein